MTVRKAALWTDGRYFLQANMELDCNWILQREGTTLTDDTYKRPAVKCANQKGQIR